MTITHVLSADAPSRLQAAERWLASRAETERVWIVAPHREGATQLVRRVVRGTGRAAFGWEPLSYGALIARLALVPLAERGRAPMSRLGAEALCARLVHERSEGASRFAEVLRTPGFPRALARTLRELRLAGLGASDLEGLDDDLAAFARAYEDALERAQLADRAAALRVAADAARVLAPALAPSALLWLDVPIATSLEAALLEGLLARATDAFVCGPRQDTRTADRVAALAPGAKVDRLPTLAEGALGRLQARLFAEDLSEGRDATARDADASDEGVVLLAAPGENAECVEIARRVLRHAAEGVAFDRMAIVLRAPHPYRPHLTEVFRRARVPLRMTPGTVRPDPTGRALLALLTCKEERYSVRAFSEYLSLAVAPMDTERAVGWVRPDPELLPFRTDARTDGLDAVDGTPGARMLRLPREWERFLVDAAVIGGRERWARRLEMHDREMARRIERLEEDDPRRSSLARHRQQLAALREFALPLLDALEALPERAPWSAWLDGLAALATRAIANPERVLQVLGELAPLGPVGPVELGEVRVVLEARLGQLVDRDAVGEGVLVVGVDEAAGLDVDFVFVPGLCEGVFPARPATDPLLSDARRAELGPELATRETQREDERLALARAVGMARRQAVLSWPEIDLRKGRPRVPSLHAMEVARAVWGGVPAYETLARAARAASAAEIGWPAPRNPDESIDEAELDLALVRQLVTARRKDKTAGLAGMKYLLEENEHLARSLRQRWARLMDRWSSADGLLVRDEAARGHLQVLARDQKVYSPTALQRLAKCPYQFVLYSLFKLAPREVPEAIEDLDPLQRGSLVHDIQFEVLMALRAGGLLPLDPTRLEAARDLLDAKVEEVADEYAEELAPAIPRVWRGAIDALRQDLHEWLTRLHEDPTWEPLAFELTFGLVRGERRDPRSTTEPVAIRDLGIRLRGSIDLVEARRPTGEEVQTLLRATDSKTGRKPAWMKGEDLRIGGGRALQPLLYAAVLEELGAALLEGDDSALRVVGGRLYYCTARGGFQVVDALLDASAREVVAKVPAALDYAVEHGFFPPAPIEGECRWCDYAPVCGPDVLVYLERKKDLRKLAPIEQIRSEA